MLWEFHKEDIFPRQYYNLEKATGTTTYIGGFVYEKKNSGSDDLQFISMEEGRIRPVRDANNNITSFVYDYFIKDHLGNVRTVLTDEQQTNYYPVTTFEGSTTSGAFPMVNYEEKFYSIDDTKITPKTSIPGWNSSGSDPKDYSNNNGNPPYNSIAAGIYPSNYTVNDGELPAPTCIGLMQPAIKQRLAL